MILSIGMIVKNEEKYLHRCLTAIEPLREKIDCELIIADTGSTDNSREIAREFTDKVYAFEWQNDFAAARNFVIGKSKGDWFMSLDADEIFEDIADIVSFFKTGEYKRYKSATYCLANFVKEADARDYTRINILRLVRRTSKTRYINPIHEALLYDGPTKALSSTAVHYGYAGDQTDKQKQKSERYRALLMEELKKNPNNAKALFDISNTYAILSDFGPALEYCERALSHVGDDDLFKVTLLASKASIYNNLKNGDMLFELTEEYFRMKKPEVATDLEMYFYQGSGAYHRKDYPKAIKAYLKYIDLYGKYKKGKLNTPDALQHALNFINEAAFRDAILRLVDSYISIKDYDSAQDWIMTIDIQEWLDDVRYMSFRLEQEYRLMALRLDFTRLAALFEQLDEKNQSVIKELLEKGLSVKAIRHAVLKEFAVFSPNKDNYFRLMALRYAYDSGTLIPETVESFITGTESWNPLYADVIYIALSAGAVKALAYHLDSSELYDHLFTSKYLHFDDLLDLISRTASKYADYQDVMIQSWLSSLYLLALTSDQLGREQVYDMFQYYSKAASCHLRAVINETFLTAEYMRLFPKQLRLGYYCYMAAEAIDRGQESGAVKYLRSVAHSFPQLKNVVETVLARLQAQKSLEKNEFDTLALQIKGNIRVLIENNKIEEAGHILNSLEQLSPNDVDIPDLKDMLKLKAGIQEDV